MMGDLLTGVDPERLTEMGDRLVLSALLGQEAPQKEVGMLIVGIDFQGGIEMKNAPLDISLLYQLDREEDVCRIAVGIQAKALFQMPDRFIPFSFYRQQLCELETRSGRRRIEGQ